MDAKDLIKLQSRDPKVKYGFTKTLLETGRTDPKSLLLLYDEWIKLAEHPNQILRWTGIDLLGYLSDMAPPEKTGQVMDLLIRYLHEGKLITANHAIFALGLIAQHRPDLRDRIIGEMLTITGDPFETEECLAIASGKVMDVLTGFPDEILKKKDIAVFAGVAANSPRNATRKRALKLLRKMEQL